MQKNPTIVFKEPKKAVIEEREMPEPGPGQVLIKTACTLISTGTELTILEADYPEGSFWEEYGALPFDPGYDNIGEVVEVGPGVDTGLVGTKAATYGQHAQYVVRDAEEIRPIHRDIADDHAVFFTIAEIVMNGIRRPHVTWGESVAVYGLGVLGQLTVQFCRLCGAMPVFGIDLSDHRLGLLPKDSAVVPVNAASQDVVSVVEKATKGRMADVVIELTGLGKLIEKQFEILRRQGRYVVLSSPRGKTSFDFHDWCNRPSYTIYGVHNLSHPPVETFDMPWTNHRHAELFFDLVADGKLEIEPLISHRVRYTDALAMYDMLMKDRGQAMTVILDWST